MEFYTSDNELYHFGILGQKWGVRRYQNLDGSLTAAGKKRYYDAKSEYQRAKNDYKSGRDSYGNVVTAKRKLRESKDLLKRAKKADAGKYMYESGKTITSNEDAIRRNKKMMNTVGTIAALSIAAHNLAKQRGIGEKEVTFAIDNNLHHVNQRDVAALAVIGASAAASLGLAVDNARRRSENSDMGAYWHRNSDVKKLADPKKKETPDWVLSEKPKNNSKVYKYSQDVLDKDANRKKYNI